MKRILTILSLCMLSCTLCVAEKPLFLYDVDFMSYFDNREYHSPYQISQTIFNFRLSPTIGVQITDTLGGKHRLLGGVHYTQRLGGNWQDVQFDPTVYYQYDYKGFTVSLGAIPYLERVERLPDFLFYDSIAYMHPNVQGALMQYRSQWGYAEAMCDWRGAQTPERREMFRVVLNGRFQYKWLELGGFAQLNHKANRAKPTPREGVADDCYINPQIGVNLAAYTHLDSLSLRAGYVFGYQRHREIDALYMPQGFMLDFFLNWRFLGISNTFYYGQNLMPFYAQFGADLNQGDPFYQSKLYNRTDLFVYLFRNEFVNCFFAWNLHYDTMRLQHQQQLVVRFNLEHCMHRRASVRDGLLQHPSVKKLPNLCGK